jgi:hypothetical protein
MSPAGRMFCEGCGGAAAASDGTSSIGYCAGCLRYLCGACRGHDALRCHACRSSRAAGHHDVSGLLLACDALGQLQDAAAELSRLADRGPIADQASVPDRVVALRVKIAATRRATAHALLIGRPSEAPTAEWLARELRDVETRIATIDRRLARRSPRASIGARASDVVRRRLPAAGPTVEHGRGPWRRPPIRRIVADAAVLGFVLLLASALMLRERAQEPVGTASVHPVPAPQPMGAVDAAGGSPGEPSETRAPEALTGVGEPAASTSGSILTLAFDELDLGSPLPGAWRITGPAGAVAVAAFPTAVDRSIRLGDHASPATMCVPVPPGAPVREIRVSFLIERAWAPEIAVLRLEAAGAADLVVRSAQADVLEAVGAGGRVSLAAGVEAGRWYALTVTLQDAIARFELGDADDDRARGATELPLTTAGAAVEAVCVGLPASRHGTGLYVDDVIITP